MKKIFLVLSVLLFPLNIFANDFSLFESLENRGALMGTNKTPIAENIADGDKARTPLEFGFSDTHYFKVGTGFKWRGFDLGAYYTSLSNTHKLKDEFKDTFPLSTSPNGKGEIKPDPSATPPILFEDSKIFTLNPNLYLTDKTKGTAEGDFSFEHYDIEAGAIFKADKIAIRFSAGMRFAKYDQSLNVNRINVPSCKLIPDTVNHPPSPPIRLCDNVDELLTTKDSKDLYQHKHKSLGSIRDLEMEIEAFGPRLGLTVSAPFTKNISLIGAVNWAVLFGERDITDNYKSTKIQKVITKNGKAGVPAKPGDITTTPITPPQPEVKAVPPVYGESIVTDKELQGGFVEKDRNNTVYNLELELGLQYKFELSERMFINFLAGYRYDIHYGVLTSCGSSKIIDGSGEDATQATYGNCGGRLSDGSVPHIASDDFIIHGPFIKTTLSF